MANDERAWKRLFTLTARVMLRQVFLRPEWELADPTHMSWSDLSKKDTDACALAKITFKKKTYWIRTVGTTTSFVMYRQDERPHSTDVESGNYYVINSYGDVIKMLAEV